MKKLLAALVCVALIVGSVSAKPKNDKNVKVINVWSFTNEVPGMIEKFKATHPDFGYDINVTIISTTDGAYQPALDQALAGGGKDAPDIYAVEAAFVLKYTQGDASGYAAKYKDLGINVNKAIKDAQIAQYAVDIGSRGKDLVALPYQATGGAFIYRRSIAKAVWGSDDPKVVKDKIGGGSGNLDKFWKAAEDLKAKGYKICSGDGDLWHAVENSSDKGWIVNNKLYIDPKREAFMDYSKKMFDNGYHNDTRDWTDAWFADMKETGTAFGFFGPAWLINYTIAPNCGGSKVGEGSYGDWAICESPLGFFWGGTWVCVNNDTKAKDAVAKIIEWILLDTSNDGLLYQWANAEYKWEYQKGADPTKTTKDTVSSGTVMAKSNGKLDFLSGQNMFDVFVPANKYATGKNLTQYDEGINQAWRDQVRAYAYGQKSKEQAIADFKQTVADKFDLDI
ncbi:MAG: carbohydrate ABC transporter substrate-binding protein [Spirochaetaceae bacterium]|nr:carbohydrate ABC transporter substrate-binding protein [Spirochaetaceae bacterium]